MKQREVQDQENTRWVCVEALSGVNQNKDLVEEKIRDEDGNVPVVCTPSGGAQTVRINLPTAWDKSLSDQELLQKIAEAK